MLTLPVEGVHVEATEAGWRASATDLKALVIAEGPADPDYPPAIPVLTAAPNGAVRASIPARDWKAAFTMADRHTRKVRHDTLRQLAVVMGDEVVTYAATDLGAVQSGTVVPVPGRYPTVTQIVPRSPATATVRLDPVLLAKVLDALAPLCRDDDDCPSVVLEFRAPTANGDDKPLVLRADRPVPGVSSAVGLLMPLGESEARRAERLAAVAAEPAAEVPVLPDASGDELRNELAGVWGKLGAAEDANRALLVECERLRAEAGHAHRVRKEAVDTKEIAEAALDRVCVQRDAAVAQMHHLRQRMAAPTTDDADPVFTLTPLPRRTLGQLAAVRKGGE